MKKIVRLLIIGSFVFTMGISIPSKACKPGEVYAEGSKFLGICFGQNGDSCARCVPAKK